MLNFPWCLQQGMWLLALLKNQNISEMQKRFKIRRQNRLRCQSIVLKDAVIGLGNAGLPFWHFCTGEIVRPKYCFSPINIAFRHDTIPIHCLNDY
jgi:hypothetical protein